jgi:hypothetical protein
MNRHDIFTIPVAGKKNRMGHRARCWANRTGIPLNTSTVGSQQQDIPRRYSEDAGNMQGSSIGLTGILTRRFREIACLLGSGTYLEGDTSTSQSDCDCTRRSLNESSARYIHYVPNAVARLGIRFLAGACALLCNFCGSPSAGSRTIAAARRKLRWPWRFDDQYCQSSVVSSGPEVVD